MNTRTAQVAVCGMRDSAEDLPAGALMTLGGKLDLNRAAAEDLRLISGIGPLLANALVAAREKRGGFRSWEEVHQVRGVGPAKLALLEHWTYLSPTSNR